MLRTGTRPGTTPRKLNIKYKGELRILCIPDTHFPFVDCKRLGEVIYAANDLRPTHIVQIGDLLDFYNYSRFPTSLSVAMPHREVREGKWMAGDMWEKLHQACPKALKFQLYGNHEDRPWKQIMRSAPALEEFLKAPLKSLLEYPNVVTMGSSLDELDINGIRFIHGWSTQRGFHMRYFQRSIAHGHTHKGDVSYQRINGKTFFELDSGILADFMARPMIYRSTLTCNWTPGFGWIDGLGPRFCPL